jgi:DNA (cytosine-5)-methyltransferase 1
MQLLREIVVDNFAGGGGASTGIELAIGRSVDIAINHDPAAIAMHEMNHPDTKHYCESVWDVNPREAVAGRPVALCWLSPDCKHFSKAKGFKPVEKGIRGLAWVALRWAATVRPRVIMLENVEEFQTWGPLDKDGYPIQQQKGRTFRSFVNALRYQGYEVEWQERRACDYGAPTIRTRLFLVARCDGKPIRWPEPSHGDPKSLQVQAKRLKPWRSAAEIIDWSLPCPSIFERKKPLVDKTLRRIARGLRKFIIENDDPFIAPVKFECNDNSKLVAAFLAQYHSETASHDARGQTLDRPLLTLDTSNRYALVTLHLVKFRGDNYGQPVTDPLQTITAGGIHHGEVRAFLISYYGTSIGSEMTEPLHTITTRDRFGLVMIHGTPYQIVDIGMRMLEPHELYPAQGFPKEYIIDRYPDGKPVPKTVQVGRCGNSVSPPMAEALVKENLPELCASRGYKEEYQYELQLI